MNFDEIVVKESPGLCRCCLSEGCYKDLSMEYTWMNDTEVYADMLLECFDISISQHMDGPNGSNRLICEVCITRLRDACNFKKQVLDSERKFVDMLARGEFQPKVLVYQSKAPLKMEELLEEPAGDDGEVEYLEDMDFEDGDDLPLKQVAEQPAEASSSDVAAEPLKIKGRRGRPRKTTTVALMKAEKKTKVSKMEDQPRTSKAIAKGTKQPSLTATRRNRLIKRNAVTILEYSTAIPFKWHRQNYLCFFCHKNFKDPEELKVHNKEHEKCNIKSAVMYLRRDEKVKIDVSDTMCKICLTKLNNLDHIVEHLKLRHGKNFAEEYGYGVIPYILLKDDFQCSICEEQFTYFVKLNQHMNMHFGTYICENCGKSFLSQDRLRCHSLSHGSGFPCNSCSATFDSLTQRNHHESKIHNKSKQLKCLYCSETFPNYNVRKRHHHIAHNIPTPEFSCPMCSKTFQIASRMEIHIKEVHLREKNFSCTMCDQKFFSKAHVQKHLIKHFGERIHTCDVCKKSYARKQTLRDHMRIHSNEKRFVCAICSQGFVQNNSLRLHMRVHHSDTNT